MTIKLLIKAVFMGFAALALSAEAAIVYKYLDTEGNVGYGDQLPAGALLLDEVEVADAPDTDKLGADGLAASNALIEQLSKTADRLQKDRLSRDAARLAEEQARAAARQQAVPPVVLREDHYYRYYPRLRNNRSRYSNSRYPGYRGQKGHNSRDIYRPAHRRYSREDDRSQRAYSPPYNGPVLSPRSPVLTP